ncbi:cytochrome P450 [Actinoplanes sp. NPDC089786]|uniref:cytochrome P450 n=1 Tax=Actinoplanes sp. NPDC089786 TaxID=3155185 RepID=UPI003438BA09
MRLSVPSGQESVDLATVDLFDPGLYASGDPHPIWTAMRERSPVHRQTMPDGRSFWSVTTYDEVNEVLRDHTRFTSQRGTLLSILGGTDPAGGKMMAASDPPVHTAMREPLMKVLSHRSLKGRMPEIRRLARRMLAPLADGGELDLAAAGAGFPMAFTGALMGLPEPDWPRLTRLTTMAIAADDPSFREGSSRGTLVAAHHELFDYFARHVRAVTADDRDDLVGFLLRMEVSGRPLELDEIVYNCYSLLLGANVTTPHAIAGTVLAFAENPGEYRRLTADPALVPSAVEEGLRWSSPANHFLRHAVHDTVLGGTPIAEGEALVAWLGSANRDERIFEDPFRFDVGRTPNRHVAFGFGPHYCVGAPLARIALRVFFEEVVAGVAEFRIAGPVEHLASNFVAGIKRLPVTADLRESGAGDLADALSTGGPLTFPAS